jgi:hypothetical protein
MSSTKVIRKYSITIALALITLIIPLTHASPVPTKNAKPPPTIVNHQPTEIKPIQSKHNALLTNLPMDFIENRGQWQTPAKFIARKGALEAALALDGITLRRKGC